MVSVQELEDSSSRRLKSAAVQLTPKRVLKPLVCEASIAEQVLGYEDGGG